MIPRPSSISGESSAGKLLRVSFITEESATQVTPGKTMRAENLYKGSFLEVSRFIDQLRSIAEVKLIILSSSKGVMSGGDTHTAYTTAPPSLVPPQTVARVLAQAIHKANDESDVIIVALSHNYLRWVFGPGMGVGLLTSLVNRRVAVVAGRQASGLLSEYARTHNCPWLVLRRVGVARVGQKNRQTILRWLNPESQPKVTTESVPVGQLDVREGA